MAESLPDEAAAFFDRVSRNQQARDLLSLSDMRIVARVEGGESFYVDVKDGDIMAVEAGEIDPDPTDPELLAIEAEASVWRDIFTNELTPGVALYENKIHIPTKMGKQNLTAAVTAAMRSVQGLPADLR